MFTYKKQSIIVGIILLPLFLVLSSYAIDTATIIKRVEDNLNGKTATMTISMKVITRRTVRTIKMESYSIADSKSFIKITYPRKDKGITFLKRDNAMWQYVPRIEKIIKIPASMMLQSWMGSDFTNDDLVKESSISKDYDSSLLSQKDASYEILLIPKEESAVVWGKIIMEVSQHYFLPTTVKYYDEDDILVRELSYEKVEKLQDRYFPTHWVMSPRSDEKQGHQTIIDISDAVFDEAIDDGYFTKRALKKFSK